MRSNFPEKTTRFLIPGAIGELEVIATTPRHHAKAVTAVICHPHPAHEGTMDNKVVTTMAKVFDAMGYRTVRFNFRGVGQSVGAFDRGVGELEDLKAVVRWVQSVRPHDALVLAGFSFGAYVSLKGSALWPIKQLVSIAPPAGHDYFVDIPEVTCPWVLVQGEQDEVVDPASQYAWIASLAIKPQLIKLPDTGHFFHGKLVALREQLLNQLSADPSNPH